MKIKAIKSKLFQPPKDDLFSAIKSSIKKVPENSILAISSKVVSISEGRCVPIDGVKKEDLIKKHSDKYLMTKDGQGRHAIYTITNNILIRSAGIDKSNAGGFYILWPKNSQKSAREIWRWIRKTYCVKNIGVIITDSTSTPLRRGTVGISLAHYGFEPLRDYRNTRDLFGRKYKFSQTNFPDSFASIAVATMGEGVEQTPFVLIEDLPHIKFGVFKPKQKKYSSFEVALDEDIYYPFFGKKKWKRGGSN